MNGSAKGPEQLERELNAFARERQRLLREHKGKFALFHGDVFVDTFSTFELAYAEGVKRFGIEPFLVRQVLEKDPIENAPALTLGLIRVHP